jgi:hypothetical protein
MEATESLMADRAATEPRLYEAIDGVVLRSLEEKLERRLRTALSEIQYVHGELKALSNEAGLPAAYRAAYARLLAIATPAFDGVSQAHEAVCHRSPEWLRFGPPELGDPPPAWIERARQVVAEINAVDRELAGSLRETQGLLLQGQPDALFDWTMEPGVEVVLTLDPGRLRAFYNHIDQEYVGQNRYRIMVDASYRNIPIGDGVDNWNPFHDPGHPLSAAGCSMDYLCHCILDHLGLPWQLLPCIHGIEATLTFHDYQTLWPVGSREARPRRVLDPPEAESR